jgi:SRSO17 transposase
MHGMLTQVEGWAAEFDQLCERISPRFARPEVRRRVAGFLRGLLGDVERKNGWQLAEQAGETTPDGMQRLLTTARWDPDGLRDDVRGYVVEHLGDPGGVLVVDETGFLKKGGKSAGGQRQYSGTAGRIENCQVGVFLTYASPKGRALVDRELYLPKEWATDAARRAEAHVPEQVGFHTKPQLAQAMLERAVEAGVPAGWVTADEVYGGDTRLRAFLEQRDLAYVLAVKATQPLWAHAGQGPAEVPARELVARLPARAWRRLSAGDGAKGPRVYDWARVALTRPGWPGRGSGCWPAGGCRTGSWPSTPATARPAPPWPSWSGWPEAAGRSRRASRPAKGQVGLDHYQVRRYDAWYRHTTLALVAQGFLAAVRAHAAPTARVGTGGG